MRVMKPGITFHGDLPRETKRFIRDTFTRAGKYFAMRRPKPRFGSGIAVAVFSYQATPPPEVCGHAGVTGNLQIFLASECWAPLSEAERQGIVVHETFHTLQHQFLNDPYALPYWLMEGSAEYASRLALDDWGLLPFSSERARMVAEASAVAAPLKQMARPKGWMEADPYFRQYSLAALAVEHLVAGKGWKPVALFLRDIQTADVANWRRSFRKVFGLSVDRFYKRFEEHRSQGFP